MPFGPCALWPASAQHSLLGLRCQRLPEVVLRKLRRAPQQVGDRLRGALFADVHGPPRPQSLLHQRHAAPRGDHDGAQDAEGVAGLVQQRQLEEEGEDHLDVVHGRGLGRRLQGQAHVHAGQELTARRGGPASATPHPPARTMSPHKPSQRGGLGPCPPWQNSSWTRMGPGAARSAAAGRCTWQRRRRRPRPECRPTAAAPPPHPQAP
mmetsp:Transcript_118065/g.345783  ORF Transcript_118065/g.345783 Transcript_118065/m.345783 type:complete len:208 (-) Transcript_118065:580-1203(-)